MSALVSHLIAMLFGCALIVALSIILPGLAIAVQHLRAARALNKEARHG